MKNSINPMQSDRCNTYAMHSSPRCGARTRRGTACLAPAMVNGRCRMHGGSATGAPKGDRNGRYKSGLFSQVRIEESQRLKKLLKRMKELAAI